MLWVVAYLSSVGGAALTVLALTIIRNDQRHSVGRLGWLGLVLLSPPVGLALLLWLGGRKISAEHRRRRLVEPPRCPTLDRTALPPAGRLLAERGLALPIEQNRVELLTDVQRLHRRLFEFLESAEKTIYVQTFIMGHRAMARDLVDLLCRKARAGVQVRLLCDGFGSFLTPDDLLDQVREAGGRAERFKPISRLSRLAYFSFRNHRKLTVVDGRRAILGGANLVEDEISATPNDEAWIDLSLAVEGPATAHLQAVFGSDWNFVTEEHLPPAEVQRCDAAEGERLTTMTVMPIGPDGPDEIMEDFWQFAIQRADRRIWISTPYFVPPPAAMRSLELACRRGLDVQILVPQVSDLPPVDFARYDYFHDLRALGAKVLRHPDRMVHAKVGIIDDSIALVGSANFDIRSFYLNYELSVAIHDRQSVQRIAEWYQGVAAECKSEAEPHSAWRSMVATGARMFASEL